MVFVKGDIMEWKTKGIVLTAPLTEEIDDVIRLIDEYLAPCGFNMIILQVRYRYQFKRHPEVWGYDPLSLSDVKKLLAVCKKNNIKLVPKMNLIGHQSGIHNEPTDGILHGHNKISSDISDGLLRAYPDFDEQYGESEILYARSICLSSKGARMIICELIEELMNAFEADSIHIGCDEGFNLGICSECVKAPKAELIANWINSINDFVKSRGGKVLIWGDRLISTDETGYNEWEASSMGTERARELLSKDIVVCDWHYNLEKSYCSVDIFGKSGFEILVCPWHNRAGAEAFINYAKGHDKGHIKGLLMTTWCGSGDLAKHILYGERGKWQHTEQIARTIKELFN